MRSSSVFFSSRRRHTSCALVTGVQTCALPIAPDAAVQFLTHDPQQLMRTGDELQGRLQVRVRAADRYRRADRMVDSGCGRKILSHAGTLPHRAECPPIWTGALQTVLACRSEEHTSELQSLMRKSYAVF